MTNAWTPPEVEAIVADYLHILMLELSGQRYNKAEHARRLQTRLPTRSKGSIAFKHCNISTVLLELGFPYIQGYKPRSNYQRLLAQIVTTQVQALPALDKAALAAVQQPAITPLHADFAKVLTPAPAKSDQVAEAPATWQPQAVKRDYLAREAQNQSLGLAGETFALQFERWRLNQLGQPRLADRIEHVSQTRGDGLGYDILSFDTSGRERFIEVKTTAFGKDTPFFVTRGELACSRHSADRFRLYRVFEFRKQPQLFELSGALDRHCILDPVTYRASFG